MIPTNPNDFVNFLTNILTYPFVSQVGKNSKIFAYKSIDQVRSANIILSTFAFTVIKKDIIIETSYKFEEILVLFQKTIKKTKPSTFGFLTLLSLFMLTLYLFKISIPRIIYVVTTNFASVLINAPTYAYNFYETIVDMIAILNQKTFDAITKNKLSIFLKNSFDLFVNFFYDYSEKFTNKSYSIINFIWEKFTKAFDLSYKTLSALLNDFALPLIDKIVLVFKFFWTCLLTLDAYWDPIKEFLSNHSKTLIILIVSYLILQAVYRVAFVKEQDPYDVANIPVFYDKFFTKMFDN